MTTKVEPKSKSKDPEDGGFVEEADIKARFLIADITSAIGKVPDEALPEVNLHLEQALQAARTAMETTKKKETEKRTR